MTAVILERPKYPHNLAAAIRACSCFGVSNLYWTGQRFTFEAGERLPREERMKGYSDVTWKNTDRPFDAIWRTSVVPVCIELTPSSRSLTSFVHPEEACYVFGPEDGGVSQTFRRLCHEFIYIPAKHCLNLSAALNVVLAHRAMQREELWTPAETENRGIAVEGWDGK